MAEPKSEQQQSQQQREVSAVAANDIQHTDDIKAETVNIENFDVEDEKNGGGAKMRTRADDLGVWESVKRYKLITAVGMAAAFAASMDGYRESSSSLSLSVFVLLT